MPRATTKTPPEPEATVSTVHQIVTRLRNGDRVADERTRRELRDAADIIEKAHRNLQVCSDTLDSIKTFCENANPEFAVSESLGAIRNNAWLAEHPEILTNVELMFYYGDRVDEVRKLLRSVHDWFLQKAPDHYKGCGLYIDVEAELSA